MFRELQAALFLGVAHPWPLSLLKLGSYQLLVVSRIAEVGEVATGRDTVFMRQPWRLVLRQHHLRMELGLPQGVSQYL